MPGPQAMTSTDAVAELGRIRFSETEFATVLATGAGLARPTIPGAEDVSITLVGPGAPTPPRAPGNGP